MDLEQRRQHDLLLKKEEELKLSSLDLQNKLDELNDKRKTEKINLEKEIKLYQDRLDQLPYPVLSINNMGFLLFMNREAEKTFGFRKKSSLGSKVAELFSESGNTEAVESFINPSKTKLIGTHKNQILISKGLKKIESNLLITKTELDDEIHYTMVLKP